MVVFGAFVFPCARRGVLGIALAAASVAALLVFAVPAGAQVPPPAAPAAPAADAMTIMFDNLASGDVALNQALVASAAKGGVCPGTYACGWVDNARGGRRGQWAGNTRHLSKFGNPDCQDGNWNDCISSTQNAGQQCVLRWWTDSDYRGTPFYMRKNEYFWNVGGFNDTFSSINWC